MKENLQTFAENQRNLMEKTENPFKSDDLKALDLKSEGFVKGKWNNFQIIKLVCPKFTYCACAFDSTKETKQSKKTFRQNNKRELKYQKEKRPGKKNPFHPKLDPKFGSQKIWIFHF
jgi:hypothetical protein